MIQSVVHIVDDASWGGVNRLLNCLVGDNTSPNRDQHKIMRINRGLTKAPQIEADVIVSHMSICWKNVAFFSSLRSTNPETPLIHVEHSYSERYVALKVANRARFEDLLRLSYALFDRVMAVSKPQAAWLARRGFVQPSQLVTISSCVKLGSFEEIASKKPQGQITIGAIGRFHEQKGFDILVEAFAAAAPADMRLLLVGDGADQTKLEKLAQRKSNIVFVPHTANPAEAMAQCDLVAMPSRWEPYGLVALEAMAAQRPLIVSNVDGLRQHIADGAIAVAENSVAGWIDAIIRLSLRDAVEALPVGKGAINAEAQFIQSWNALIESLTTNSGKSQMAA